MILNLETFDQANPDANRDQFDLLLRMLDEKAPGKISVGWRSMRFVDSVLSVCRGRLARDLTRRYFKGWDDATLVHQAGVTVTPSSSQAPLTAAYMSVASHSSEMTIGLAGSVYKDDFAYLLMPGAQECRMLTSASHFNEGDYKRWTFLARFRDDDEYKKYITIESSSEHKHFDSSRTREPIRPDSQWGKSWIESTQSSDAKFMPGLQYKSHEYYYLIYLALKKAYAKGLYSEGAQNKFELDLNTPIGSAGGDITTKIMLYCTTGNTVHIRPLEMHKKHTGVKDVLKRPYQPTNIDYELE